MNLVLLGLPGAGKGTQAKKLNEEYGLPHIATGDIFRQAIKDGTPLGKKAKEYIDTGKLVPDEVTIGIIKDRLADDDCKEGFLLDGFPRTLNQAEALSQIRKIELALYLEADEKELVERLSGRRICEKCGRNYHVKYNPPREKGICDQCGGKLIQRSDDKEETVKKRLEVNKEQMQELLEYYQEKGVLKTIKSIGNIDEVYEKINTTIKGTFK